MKIPVAKKKQTAFRLDDEPNEITIAAMKKAMSGNGKELDLAKWNELVASL